MKIVSKNADCVCLELLSSSLEISFRCALPERQLEAGDRGLTLPFSSWLSTALSLIVGITLLRAGRFHLGIRLK